jgi:hypothetical protein
MERRFLARLRSFLDTIAGPLSVHASRYGPWPERLLRSRAEQRLDVLIGREAAEESSRGGSVSSQIKCLRRGADNAAANCGLN